MPGLRWVPTINCDGWVPEGHPGARLPGLPEPPAQPPAQPPGRPAAFWTYVGQSFLFQFDHSGDGLVEGYYVDVNGATLATVPLPALVNGRAQVNFAAGLPVPGRYEFVVRTFITGGVVTATSDPITVDVRPSTGTGKAQGLEIVRGGGVNP